MSLLATHFVLVLLIIVAAKSQMLRRFKSDRVRWTLAGMFFK